MITMRRKALLSILLAVALLPINWSLTPASPAQAEAAGSASNGGTYRTKEEVIAKWNQYRPTSLELNPYLAEPSIYSPYTSGQLQSGTLQDGLNMLNFMRYLAGMPDDVELDPELTRKAQYGAVVLSAYGEETHSPLQVSDMDSSFYQLGLEGTLNSNINTAGWSPPSSSILTWLHDTDSTNIADLGHRRWVLNPAMKKTGFGYSPAKGGGNIATMYTTDASRKGFDYSYVPYPSAGYFPKEFMRDFAWNVTLNPKKYRIPNRFYDDVQVQLTRQSDGKTWSFSNYEVDTPEKQFYLTGQEYGTGSSITFYTADLADANTAPDESYHVHISGIQDIKGNPTTIDYDTHTFELIPDTTTLNLHTAAADELSQFRGITVDGRTNEPLGGVEVIISDSNEQRIGSVFSDSNGHFRLAGLTDGSYSAAFASDAYLSNETTGFTVNEQRTKYITPSYERIYTLTKADIIGKIVDPSGNPVSNASVTIWDSHTTTGANGIYALSDLEQGRTYIIYVNPGEDSKYESQQLSFTFTDINGPTITLKEKKTSTIPDKPADPDLTIEQIEALKDYWRFGSVSQINPAFTGSTASSLKAPVLLSVTPFYKTVNNRSVADYAFQFSSATTDSKRELTYQFTTTWAKDTPQNSGSTQKVTIHTGSAPIEVRNDVPNHVYDGEVHQFADPYEHWGYLADVQGIGFVQVLVSDQKTGHYAASVKYWFDFSDPEHPKPIPPAKDYYKAWRPYEYQFAKFDSIYVFINGIQQTYTDQKPIMKNGTTLVPLRGIFEALGAAVKWNASTQTVTATRGTDKVVLTIGKNQATVNGHSVTLDQKAQIIGGSTMVPLRFIGESFQANVVWDKAYQSVRIDTTSAK
jgi:Uncharacterized protein with SCP/PR1 domains